MKSAYKFHAAYSPNGITTKIFQDVMKSNPHALGIKSAKDEYVIKHYDSKETIICMRGGKSSPRKSDGLFDWLLFKK